MGKAFAVEAAEVHFLSMQLLELKFPHDPVLSDVLGIWVVDVDGDDDDARLIEKLPGPGVRVRAADVG